MSGPSADREWIRSVVGRFERQLTAYAAHVCGGGRSGGSRGRDLERARDIVQETFVRLCGVDRERVEPHLAQWLFTVCRNLAIDVKRKERRMNLLSEIQAESYPSDDAGPGDAAERDDSVATVLQSMADLPEAQQEVIRLKFQHGLSYRQIGEILNLTVTNVGFLIHTGLKTLRKRLADEQTVGRK